MTKVGFNNFFTPILRKPSSGTDIKTFMIDISESIWSNPFSYKAKKFEDGTIKKIDYNNVGGDHIGKMIKTCILGSRVVAITVFATATYFKPKWGLAFAGVSLIPKLCHRGLMTIPPNEDN